MTRYPVRWIYITVLIHITRCTPPPALSFKRCSSNFHSDCSAEMFGEYKGSCQIYNTSVCQSYNFTSWSETTLSHPFKESAAVFTITISPFAHIYFPGQTPVSALNITFISKEKYVNGYALFVIDDAQNKTICRIFDFRNSTEPLKMPVSFFYDQLSCLVEGLMFKVRLVFRAYPVNEELSYEAFLPDVSAIEPTTPCKWKPIIMVFLGSLTKNTIEVKFSQAPSHLNISSYHVKLMDASHRTIKDVIVSDVVDKGMLTAEFHSINRGYYYVSIKPLFMPVLICKGGATNVFFIENSIIDSTTIVCIAAITITGVMLVISVQCFLRWIFKPGPVTSRPLILLVYSHDCSEHKKMIKSYIKFLENQCNVKVVTIYGESGIPETWIQNVYLKASVIMIVLSEGLYHTIEKSNNPPVIEDHKWRRLLPSAISFIMKQIFYSQNDNQNKKFCKVCFSYSNNQPEPKCIQFQPWGQTYIIPREINRLLCYMFDTTPKVRCCKVYPLMPGHDVVSLPDGITLIENIEEMKVAVKNKQHIQFEEEISTDSPVRVKSTVNTEIVNEGSNEYLCPSTSLNKCTNDETNDVSFMEACISLKSQQKRNASVVYAAENEALLHAMPKLKSNFDDHDSFWKTVLQNKSKSSCA